MGNNKEDLKTDICPYKTKVFLPTISVCTGGHVHPEHDLLFIT